MLVIPVYLGLSACQTVADSQAPAAWSSAPGGPPPVTRVGASAPRADGYGGAPLLANARGGPSTILEGSGRFVGEPPTGSISRDREDVADGVTINLVNVTAPQAARSILGDILGVKYTVDPGIEGKITIHTPNSHKCFARRVQPVSKKYLSFRKSEIVV